MSTLAKQEEYTSDQWKELESEFEKIKYPDDYTREEFAKEMGLTAEQVNKWFQSRRSRERNRERLADYLAQLEKKHFISSERLAKLESEFEKTKYPDISMRKKMAEENRLTEKQVKIWFRNRRDQWKLQGAEETLGSDQHEKQKLQQKEDKTETTEQTVAETKQQNFSSDQLDILKGAFDERKYPDIFMLEELARETGITVDRIQVWFQKRRAQHRREEREANAKKEQEKKCSVYAECHWPCFCRLHFDQCRSWPCQMPSSDLSCRHLPGERCRQIGQKSAFNKVRIGQQRQKQQRMNGKEWANGRGI